MKNAKEADGKIDIDNKIVEAKCFSIGWNDGLQKRQTLNRKSLERIHSIFKIDEVSSVDDLYEEFGGEKEEIHFIFDNQKGAILKGLVINEDRLNEDKNAEAYYEYKHGFAIGISGYNLIEGG